MLRLTPKEIEWLTSQVLEHGLDLDGLVEAASEDGQDGILSLTRNRLAKQVRLIKRESIKAAIRDRQALAEMVLRRLLEIAYGDPRRIFSWGPEGVRVRPSCELSADEAATIIGVSQKTSVVRCDGVDQRIVEVEVRRESPLKALAILAKLLEADMATAPLLNQSVLVVPQPKNRDEWEASMSSKALQLTDGTE